MDAEGAGDVQQAVRFIGIQEQHGAGIAAISPLGFGQDRRMRVDLQVVAEISSRREIDRAADSAGRVQRLLDSLRVRRLAVAFGAEITHVENGRTLCTGLFRR